MPGVKYRLLIDLWTNFIVFNCQVVEFILILAHPVFKNPGILRIFFFFACAECSSTFVEI